MIGSNTRDYKQDKGENLYRRSMYTLWKRAAPPASMDIFNAPSREVCTVRRERTDTPLQALEAVFLVMYRFRAAGPGLDHFPRKGPVLIVANHSAWLDPCWVAKVVPRSVPPWARTRTSAPAYRAGPTRRRCARTPPRAVPAP